jgi:hypothetical protein
MHSTRASPIMSQLHAMITLSGSVMINGAATEVQLNSGVCPASERGHADEEVI